MHRPLWALAPCLALAAGCASKYAERAAYPQAPVSADTAASGKASPGFGYDAAESELALAPFEATPPGDLLVGDDRAPAAMAPPAPPKDGDGGRAGPRPEGGTAVQPGRSHPLLIHTAELHLAVFETAATQQAVADLATRLGGFLAYRDDTRITIRIPSRGFNDSVTTIEKLGDVLHRNVKALDVTEEFRDLATRLRNAEAVRGSLERLLERANKVEDALKVQAELAKVTETIERLKGRLRYLEDRIAFSTISVIFQPRSQPALNKPSTFRLPFPWMDRVGLRGLLELN